MWLRRILEKVHVNPITNIESPPAKDCVPSRVLAVNAWELTINTLGRWARRFLPPHQVVTYPTVNFAAP